MALIMPMFLFSGIFIPVEGLPVVVQWIVRATPLYHAVALLRQLTTGNVTFAIVGHVAYLVIAGTAAFTVAMYRLERTLIK